MNEEKTKLQEFDDNYDPSLYEIKDYCAWCGAKIDNFQIGDKERFRRYGNSCYECASRHSKIYEKKISREEASAMLKHRILEVELSNKGLDNTVDSVSS